MLVYTQFLIKTFNNDLFKFWIFTTNEKFCLHEEVIKSYLNHCFTAISTFVVVEIIKVHLVRAMVFPVVMYGCESWTTKKTECRRIDAFELWCWRRLLRDPWTARRSNQSTLKEISPGYSLEGLMMKLKLQYFGHLM